MPHVLVECSANLGLRVNLERLVAAVHAAALESGIFPIGGTRTRLAERAHYRIADGDPANAFCHVMLRIGAGRDAATKQRAAQTIFDAVCAALAEVSATSPLAISLELEEIDPATSFKANNLHAYVQERQAHP